MGPSEMYQPSDAQLEILQVLWENGPSTVRFVHETLAAEKQIGYTTTLTQMQRMTKKGMIERVGRSQPHEYAACVQEGEVQQTLLGRLRDTAFKGSAMRLVMHALGQEEVDANELAKLEEWLAEQKRNRHE